MSAFIVGDEHIRYLVNAALYLQRRSVCSSEVFSWHAIQVERGGSSPSHMGALHDTSTCPHRTPTGYKFRCESCPTPVGQMLTNENHKSVNWRYPDGENGGAIYQHRAASISERFDPVQVLKAVACYEYQTCEHPGWWASSARAFCAALTEAAVRALPGWNDAAWGAPRGKAA